jgi:hypothetical protein
MIWKLLRRVGIHPMFRTRGRVSAVRFGKPDTEGEARCWLSWHGLVECRCGEEIGILRHGRAWFHFGSNCFGWEWVLGRLGLGAEVTADLYGGEHELSGHLTLPFVRVYWHVDRIVPQRFRAPVGAWWKRVCGYDGRETGFDCHNGALWVKLWAPENGWDSKQPKWMDWNFNPADFFLGRHRHSEQELNTTEGFLHLPEGDYPVKVTLSESTWKRPRWPFIKRQRGVEIVPETPIPIPGKGENSWDCGDDAIYSWSTGAETAEEAGNRMVASILERRERYGGKDWRVEVAA